MAAASCRFRFRGSSQTETGSPARPRGPWAASPPSIQQAAQGRFSSSVSPTRHARAAQGRCPACPRSPRRRRPFPASDGAGPSPARADQRQAGRGETGRPPPCLRQGRGRQGRGRASPCLALRVCDERYGTREAIEVPYLSSRTGQAKQATSPVLFPCRDPMPDPSHLRVRALTAGGPRPAVPAGMPSRAAPQPRNRNPVTP